MLRANTSGRPSSVREFSGSSRISSNSSRLTTPTPAPRQGRTDTGRNPDQIQFDENPNDARSDVQDSVRNNTGDGQGSTTQFTVDFARIGNLRGQDYKDALNLGFRERDIWGSDARRTWKYARERPPEEVAAIIEETRLYIANEGPCPLWLRVVRFRGSPSSVYLTHSRTLLRLEPTLSLTHRSTLPSGLQRPLRPSSILTTVYSVCRRLDRLACLILISRWLHFRPHRLLRHQTYVQTHSLSRKKLNLLDCTSCERNTWLQ